MSSTLKLLYSLILATVLLSSCNSGTDTQSSDNAVNVYTHRHYDVDQLLFEKFTETTGIKVNVVSASADELIKKLEMEGSRSPADILITVDAGRLQSAASKGLLQPVDSEILKKNIPSAFRDIDNKWFGFTYRARALVYNKDKVQAEELSTYEALAEQKWQGRVLTRSSENVYNQSLVASVIADKGLEETRTWAEGLTSNFARTPKGNDRDQIKAVASGLGDVAIVNTYYLGKLLESKNPEEIAAVEKTGVFFPNQEGYGTHINISGAGVAAHAPNKDNAVKFLKFLSSETAQQIFTDQNYEYPVNTNVQWSTLLQSWGTFKADTTHLSVLGEKNREAVILMDEIGWK
ncbi:Fe(3+) ABC transporter substrate-binding protein [Cytophagaceae bacterium ABcell3]|nr:Fe(3+) ABC transporter substrate-binding protein [Cytophagaceae bacterium ABcell3]